MMWYFAWALGMGFACSFAILNAMWLELNCTLDAPEAGVATRFRRWREQTLAKDDSWGYDDASIPYEKKEES